MLILNARSAYCPSKLHVFFCNLCNLTLFRLPPPSGSCIKSMSFSTTEDLIPYQKKIPRIFLLHITVIKTYLFSFYLAGDRPDYQVKQCHHNTDSFFFPCICQGHTLKCKHCRDSSSIIKRGKKIKSISNQSSAIAICRHF